MKSAHSALLTVPTFFGAFLLFVAEPMLAKWLLPSLGGNPSTWTAAMLSFQLLLLVGYGYAHCSTRSLSLRGQASLQIALLVAGGSFVLWAFRSSRPELSALPPALAVPLLLIGKVGLPYVVLAGTTPLLVRWTTAARRDADSAGRPLYAISNAGALIGLFAYPFAVERLIDVPQQLAAWAFAFVGFTLAFVPVCVLAYRLGSSEAPAPSLEPAARPPLARRLRWLALAFVPSVFLLAATNHITVDVAAVPLLWILPLALYLGSFIVGFSVWNASFRGPTLAAWLVGAVGIGANAYAQGAASLVQQIGATLLALTGSCLACHGELASDRPAAQELTGYYLLIALGGALGGVFVGLVAPYLFTDFYELELAALATFLLLWFEARRTTPEPWRRAPRLALYLGFGVCVPLLVISLVVRSQRDTPEGHVVERVRSFLGPLRVVDVPEGRLLTHGRIRHGMQLRDPALRRTPTLYFGEGTALERALRGFRAERPRRIGVVGLGVGTLATYGRAGDTLRFYELDANVIAIARRDFTFLADSAATIEIVLGDGRLSLAREAPQRFDLLVLDAFASDAVPVHLLTREAFAVYVSQLAPDGLLLVNVSNRYLCVDRVVRASAEAHGLSCQFVDTPTNGIRHVAHVEWALIARDRAMLAALVAPLLSGSSVARSVQPAEPSVLWTDNHASLLAIVR